MKLNIGMVFDVGLHSNGAFLDDLILSTKELFQKDAIGKFLGFILESVDKTLCDSLVQTSSELSALLPGWNSCCKTPKLRRYRKENKKFATSVGTIPYECNRLRCKSCRKSVVPLQVVLALKKRQTESGEFQKLACETVAQQSFRRSCKHLTQIGGIKINRMKLHRILSRADADLINLNIRGAGALYLIADGTGFPEWKPTMPEPETLSAHPTEQPQSEKKEKPNKVKERKSDLKVVIALNQKHEMIPGV